LLGINMGLFNLTEWDFFYKTGALATAATDAAA
jgi:hypothetical protein